VCFPRSVELKKGVARMALMLREIDGSTGGCYYIEADSIRQQKKKEQSRFGKGLGGKAIP